MRFFKRHVPRNAGLSLVEVALALGIVSFVLIAVFSLTATSLRQLQFSEADSKLASVAQQSLALARFELGRDRDFRTPPAPWQSGRRELFFDKEGRILGENDGHAYFRARLRLEALPAASSNALANVPSDSLKALGLEIEWPVAAGTNAAVNTQSYSLLLWNSGRL